MKDTKFGNEEKKNAYSITTMVIPLLIIVIFSMNIMLTHDVYASSRELSFAEIAQTAHLIFIGTVTKQNCRWNEKHTMIFSDIYFKDIDVIHSTEFSVQKTVRDVTLTYAGGCVDSLCVEVSGTPRFINHRRYLIFMLDDGKIYRNPLIGGSQGLFEVIRDDISKKEYILSAGGKAVVAVTAEKITLSSNHALNAQTGIQNAKRVLPDNFHAIPPVSNMPGYSASISENYLDEKVMAQSPLRLSEFLNYINNVALTVPIERKRLRSEGQGLFYRNVNGKLEIQKINSSKTFEYISKNDGLSRFAAHHGTDGRRSLDL
jgi:hypothetical protein